MSPKDLIPVLEKVKNLLETLDENSFTSELIKTAVWPYAELEGRGVVLWSLRVSLSGKERSPDPFSSASILGKEETLKRLDTASNFLNE
jgi:glutamyl/glutaminyl-tRNA synthetase